jgi:hypothetical protein
MYPVIEFYQPELNIDVKKLKPNRTYQQIQSSINKYFQVTNISGMGICIQHIEQK